MENKLENKVEGLEELTDNDMEEVSGGVSNFKKITGNVNEESGKGSSKVAGLRKVKSVRGRRKSVRGNSKSDVLRSNIDNKATGTKPIHL